MNHEVNFLLENANDYILETMYESVDHNKIKANIKKIWIYIKQAFIKFYDMIKFNIKKFKGNIKNFKNKQVYITKDVKVDYRVINSVSPIISDLYKFSFKNIPLNGNNISLYVSDMEERLKNVNEVLDSIKNKYIDLKKGQTINLNVIENNLGKLESIVELINSKIKNIDNMVSSFKDDEYNVEYVKYLKISKQALFEIIKYTTDAISSINDFIASEYISDKLSDN